ncbi:MAG: AMP-binding protein [Frankiaceae bacterium]|nr:AMP-binding protein [Frankiaceae bacterium]MBV9869029.1 AMP-binding protein [Frankiaceae bacterium]
MKVPLTAADFLSRAELVYGDRVGVIDEPTVPDSLGEVTYGEVARRARALQAGLDELGVDVGERVAVVSPNAARMLELFYAVPTSGRVLVPINFRLRSEEVEYIVDHSGSSVLLVDPEIDEGLPGVTAKHRFLLGGQSDEALLRFDREPQPWRDIDEDATATINYTSGTTARPKGVQITHRNIWVNAVTFGLHAGVSDWDTYLHTLPMFHANGWGMPYTVAGMGCPQVVLRKVDGTDILTRIQQHDVTLMCAAPAVLNAILDAAPNWSGPIPGGDRVARVVAAGAPPPSKTIERIETELGWEFCQIYGLTETSPLLTINRRRREQADRPIEDVSKELSRAGAPAIGVQLDISDSGEVLAKSNVVLEGYWNQPDVTADALEGGWFHTGDGGFLDDEGHLTISDRKKDVIITGGENVSSIEVEDVLYSADGVAECAVIGVPDEKWGETIKAIVVRKPGSDVSEADLIAYCKTKAAGYKAPTSVDFVDAIPRTATGKVQKFKLRDPYWQGRDRQVN